MAAETGLLFFNRKYVLVFLFTCLFFGINTRAQENCILRGRIHTSLEWYGYLLQKTFQQNISKIHYTISYPVSECCANLLIYYDDQMRELNSEFTCKQREALLPASNNQIIPLTSDNGTAGCSIWEENGKEPMNVCVGERTFKSSAPRTWYIAISRCGVTRPLILNYMFNISGYYGNCEEDPLANTYIPPKQTEDKTNLHLAIAMGVIAGIAIVVSIVFITLYIISRRQMKEKPKTNGSVTSSQATMTQDIFYVNPSLSDRDHSDSQYSRSSSENYYEVIPDRRSYESINTQLALHGHHPGRNLNFASLSREHRNRIPSYIFEDIPPPPYQPPGLQGGHAHQGSHHPQGPGSGAHLLAVHSSGPASHHSGIQQMPMTSRMLATSAGGLGVPGTIATTTRMPLQSSAHAPMTSGNALQIPEHSSTGSSSSGPSQHLQQTPQNTGITTSAGGLNSHNSNTLPRSQAGSDHPISTQNGGPVQNGVLNHGTVSRYPLHNANHAKLLHQAYRIQQFETTA